MVYGLHKDRANFPDKTFRQYVKRFDKNKNGILSNSELKAVTVINVEGKEIRKIEGIQYFTSLKKLNCSFNPLTKIDVSKNKKLIKLDCSATDVKKLDLSKNALLVTLNCSECYLTKLDVTHCPLLKELNCDGNRLTKLDVRKNPALKYLYVGSYTSSYSGNLLKSLDLSKNTKLIALSCEHNPIKKIDVSKCSTLVKLVKKNKRTHFEMWFDYWQSGNAYLSVPDTTIVIAGNKTSKPFSHWSEWSAWTTEKKTDIDYYTEEEIRHHWWAAKCKNCGAHNPYWGSTTKCVSCKKYLPASNVQHVNVYTQSELTVQKLHGRNNGAVIDGKAYWHAGIEYRYRSMIDSE